MQQNVGNQTSVHKDIVMFNRETRMNEWNGEKLHKINECVYLSKSGVVDGKYWYKRRWWVIYSKE